MKSDGSNQSGRALATIARAGAVAGTLERVGRGNRAGNVRGRREAGLPIYRQWASGGCIIPGRMGDCKPGGSPAFHGRDGSGDDLLPIQLEAADTGAKALGVRADLRARGFCVHALRGDSAVGGSQAASAGRMVNESIAHTIFVGLSIALLVARSEREG